MNRFAVRLAFTLLCVIASFPLFAITRTWTGAINGNWSVAENWSPSGAPDPTDALIFPANAANKGMTNDLPPATPFGAMTFNDSNGPYTLSGNLLALTGDVFALVAYADLRLGASVEFVGRTKGAIDINGHTLTSSNMNIDGPINGDGMIVSQGVIIIQGSGGFDGTISGQEVWLGESVLPNATVSVQKLWHVFREATLGDLTSGSVECLLLHTKSFTLSQGGLLRAMVVPVGTTQIDVTGTVALNAASLRIFVSGTIAAGQTFTLINNDGADAINGTFVGLPEGAVVDGVTCRFRISYIGGDGNDVVLTTLVDTHTAISQSAGNTQLGELVTLTATVTAQSGSPNGSVVFNAGGVPIGSAPLQNGIAELTVTMLAAGTHNIVAAFVGTGPFADSVSAGLTHVVLRRQTQSVIYAHDSIAHYGQEITFTVVISALPLASVKPTGTVTFRADGVWLGIITVANETATFSTAALHAGVKSITASYSGDANFEASDASAIQQNIGKAPTALDVRWRPLFLGEIPLITVFMSAIPDSMVPHGDITITENGAVLGTQSDVWGVAKFSLMPLALGEHTLVVNYSGTADLEASTATIIQSVVAPRLTFQGARVIECNKDRTTFTLVVSLSVPILQLVRVSFSTIPGTATEGEDYEKASGVIEFAPGEVTRTIELHILGDMFPEVDETFSVLLSDPVNATIDTPSAVIVIANDDQVPPRHRPSRH